MALHVLPKSNVMNDDFQKQFEPYVKAIKYYRTTTAVHPVPVKYSLTKTVVSEADKLQPNTKNKAEEEVKQEYPEFIIMDGADNILFGDINNNLENKMCGMDIYPCTKE